MTSSPTVPQQPRPAGDDRSVERSRALPLDRVEAATADAGRLQAVARYPFFDPAVGARLDAITARTRERLGLPLALVSVVLDEA